MGFTDTALLFRRQPTNIRTEAVGSTRTPHTHPAAVFGYCVYNRATGKILYTILDHLCTTVVVFSIIIDRWLPIFYGRKCRRKKKRRHARSRDVWCRVITLSRLFQTIRFVIVFRCKTTDVDDVRIIWPQKKKKN